MGTLLKREFTFYNFTNPMDVMFAAAKPKFVEVGPFSNII
jgi:hypothetical protein